MPDKIGSIIWTISAKTDELRQGLKTALDKVNIFKSSTESADRSSSSFESTIGLLSQSFTSLDKSISESEQQVSQFGKTNEEVSSVFQRHMAEEAEIRAGATDEINRMTDEMFGTSYATESASQSTTQFAEALKRVDEEARASQKNILSLKSAVEGLVTGYMALRAVRWIADQLRESVDIAGQTERAMALTKSTIEATGMTAGITAEKIREMANEIQRNTAISSDSAQAGMNMLLEYTRIGENVFPKATEAMLDMATAINGGVIPSATQLESSAKQIGSALNDPINGVRRLTQSGITFTEQQKEQIRTLVESNRLVEAQGVILERLAVFQGSAEAQAETYQGRIASLNNEFNDIKRIIGQAVIPAIEHFIEGLSVGGTASEGLVFAIRGLISAFTGLITIARMAGIAISTALSAGFALIQGDFQTAKNALKVGLEDIVQEGVKTQESLTKIWSSEASKQTDYSLANYKEQEQGSSSKSQKIIDDLEKETEAYRRAVEKRQVQFERSMADLIWAHQDKVKQLREDLRNEQDTFSTIMDERTKKFNESMLEMEQSHLKKVETIEKQLAREEQKQDDKVAEALNKGQKQLDEEEKLFSKREAIIESQIESELAKGEWASDSVLETLRRRLDNERAIHGIKVDEIKNQIDEETKKAIDAHAYRIEDLQEKLSEATASNKKEKEGRELSYEEETTKLLREHQQRVSNFQSSLDEELSILDRHQDSVDMVKDQARLDDIARLKRQFSEQAKEEEINHRQRMNDIRNRGSEAGVSYGQFFNDGLRGIIPEVQNTSRNIADTLKRTAQATSNSDGRTLGQLFMDGIKFSIESNKYSLKNQIEDALKFSISPVWGITSAIGNLLGTKGYPAFADGVTNFGGGLALVGERGPEIVNLPKGSDVIPNEKIGEIGGNIVINIDQVNDKSDVDMLIRELGFKQSIMH